MEIKESNQKKMIELKDEYFNISTKFNKFAHLCEENMENRVCWIFIKNRQILNLKNYFYHIMI